GRFLTGGILSCNPVLEAAHHDCTGHTRHRGDRNEQTVAPSSMIAWLTARGSAERTNFSAAVQSSPGFSSIQPCILETTLRTLPSTIGYGLLNAMLRIAPAIYRPMPGNSMSES